MGIKGLIANLSLRPPNQAWNIFFSPVHHNEQTGKVKILIKNLMTTQQEAKPRKYSGYVGSV